MGSSTFVKVYDDLEDHPNWQAIDSLAEAVGLWTLAFIYCGRNLTDGHFPARMVQRRWAGSDVALRELLNAGRWHAPGHDCADCPQPAEGNLYMHAYLERNRSRERVLELSEKRAEAGRAGGNARVAKQLAKPSSSRSKPDNRVQIQKKDTAADAAEFELFWERYPRRVAKPAATKAWTKARKDADMDTIMRGLLTAITEWRAARTELQFIPHPASWLNAARWADEVPTIPGTPNPAEQRITLAQCNEPELHGKHTWDRGANKFGCQGVEA